MNPKLRIKLVAYIMKIAGKDDDIKQMIGELVKDQAEQIVKNPNPKVDEKGLKFYEDMLKTLKPEKAPQIEYFTFLDKDDWIPPMPEPKKK